MKDGGGASFCTSQSTPFLGCANLLKWRRRASSSYQMVYGLASRPVANSDSGAQNQDMKSTPVPVRPRESCCNSTILHGCVVWMCSLVFIICLSCSAHVVDRQFTGIKSSLTNITAVYVASMPSSVIVSLLLALNDCCLHLPHLHVCARSVHMCAFNH